MWLAIGRILICPRHQADMYILIINLIVSHSPTYIHGIFWYHVKRWENLNVFNLSQYVVMVVKGACYCIYKFCVNLCGTSGNSLSPSTWGVLCCYWRFYFLSNAPPFIFRKFNNQVLLFVATAIDFLSTKCSLTLLHIWKLLIIYLKIPQNCVHFLFR